MEAHMSAVPDDAETLLLELAALAPDDPRGAVLRERLVAMHLRLAREVARRYRDRGEPVEDLEQAAAVGLVKAINRYRADVGSGFLAYAMPMMTGEVKRHFRDKTWAVHVPRKYQEQRALLNLSVAEFTQQNGRSPTVAELAARMELSEEEVLATMDAAASYNAVSLDTPVTDEDEGGATLADTLGDADDRLAGVVDKEALKPLLDALPGREKRILLLRFFGNKTQAEIAAEVGISQMHVSRLLSRTLARLRTRLLADA
ncbi:MAG: SigB/SigF/SigG family RNA polymerase sigma factor [Streptosporangiales bacterium]|nr:SigB/SigF/SigG family RNA polymerase sigma factor [Streptosporangiales bacterium]